MIELSVIFGLYVIGSLTVMFFFVRQAREERSELEDRLMALSKPEAVILHKAQRDPEPASISYMDEEAEVQRNGHVELLEDD